MQSVDDSGGSDQARTSAAPYEPIASRAARLRRLHSFSGVVPLGVYLGFHGWEHWPVRDGRDPLLARLELSTSTPIEILAVLLPLLLHAALGLGLARERDPSPAYASPAFRRLQLATGLITAAFLGWHVVGVWLPGALASQRAVAYAAMLDQVGTLAGAGLYVVGLSAVCVHFGQGLSAVWIRQRSGGSPALARACGVLLGVVLWLVLLNQLAAYATYAPLL